jgi:hypothetical protein
VKEDVEETLEVERKVIWLYMGMQETDAKQDVESVVEMMTEVFHMDFARNVEKMERIGRLVEGRPHLLRVVSHSQ